MRAREVAEDFPLVQLSDDALDVARRMAQQRLSSVVVVDERGSPVTVLPGSQVLAFLVPDYARADPSLATVHDEGAAPALAGRQVRELLPPKEKRTEMPVVDGAATVVECAARMARLGGPLLVVAEQGKVHGVLTASHLLDLLMPGS